MSPDLVQRLKEGRERARGEFVPWHCRRGHVTKQRPDAVAVTCGHCSRDVTYRGSVEMRRVDLFPNWDRSKEDE